MGIFDGISDGSRNGPNFEAQVNKGKIRMEGLTNHLNARWANGYKLMHIYEQDGNTVVIWQKIGT